MSKRATIYLDEGLHRALKIKAAALDRTISDLVNEAVRQNLGEDAEDLAVFEDREEEPVLLFEEVAQALLAKGAFGRVALTGYQRLEAIARSEGRTPAELVREAVTEYANRRSSASRPTSVGAGHSGRGDLSERAEELLAGLGRAG